MAKEKSKIRVRIAPSPTGYAHVGTAYTALFNYAFARHHQGKFIIRIEDSDKKRNIKGAEDKIYDALIWLGIDWDEGTTKGGDYGPYKISERLEIYQKKAKELVESGKAYEDDGAIRFKNPGEDISWDDLVRGKITFPGEEITDFVILKSDGYPTYNFNVVIDDAMMEISNVIRGDDHISNTPRQIALYKAFGFDVPKFAHHPLLLNNKKQKLSKRDAAVDVQAYKDMGILPEAFVNFLCLMGWSHPDEKEIFSLEEFVEKFTIERVRKSGAIFDVDKLMWVNGQYIQKLPEDKLAQMLSDFYEQKYDLEIIKKVTPLINTRIKTLKEFEDIAGFLFQDPKVKSSDLKDEDKTHLKSAYEALQGIDSWDLENLNEALMSEVEKKNFKTGKFFMSLRLGLTGSKITPPINESLEILGKDEALKRLKDLLE